MFSIFAYTCSSNLTMGNCLMYQIKNIYYTNILLIIVESSILWNTHYFKIPNIKHFTSHSEFQKNISQDYKVFQRSSEQPICVHNETAKMHDLLFLSKFLMIVQSSFEREE